jgi:hypothetical protein
MASDNSMRPVCFNSSPVIVMVPGAARGSLMPAGACCRGVVLVAQAHSASTVRKNNDFIVIPLNDDPGRGDHSVIERGPHAAAGTLIPLLANITVPRIWL